jgi:hypothetical protein
MQARIRTIWRPVGFFFCCSMHKVLVPFIKMGGREQTAQSGALG